MVKERKLLLKIKEITKEKLSKNKRFHDYAHAISVFENAKMIIKSEKLEERVDSLVILTAALFHDLSDHDGGAKEGLDGAQKTRKILEKVNDFPKDRIKEVERLIISLEKKGIERKLDEKILHEADFLESLSKIGICRSFMLYSKRGLNLEKAIIDYYDYINKKIKRKNYFTKTSKKMAREKIPFVKKFSEDCLKKYA